MLYDSNRDVTLVYKSHFPILYTGLGAIGFEMTVPFALLKELPFWLFPNLTFSKILISTTSIQQISLRLKIHLHAPAQGITGGNIKFAINLTTLSEKFSKTINFYREIVNLL